jgi:hypothetical protein
MPTLKPFLVQFALDSAQQDHPSDATAPHLEFDRELQRNRLLVGDRMIDICDAGSMVEGRELLTMTKGSTMTQVPGERPGTYKLDDDSE